MYLITEFKEYRKTFKIISNFPDSRQTFNYDCGSSVIQMICVYHGFDYNESEIIKMTKTSKKYGLDPKTMVQTLHHLGIGSKLKQNLTIEELKSYLDQDIPIICVLQAYAGKKDINYLQAKSHGHYSIVIGYDRKHLIFSDPASFNKTYLSYEEMEERWHDEDRHGNEYNHLGIIIPGKRQFSETEIIHMD